MFRLWNNVLQRTKGLTHFNSAKQTLNMRSTTIPNMSNFWRPGRKINFKKKPSKFKYDQKVQGSNQLKTTLNHEEGTTILRNLGTTVVAATGLLVVIVHLCLLYIKRRYFHVSNHCILFSLMYLVHCVRRFLPRRGLLFILIFITKVWITLFLSIIALFMLLLGLGGIIFGVLSPKCWEHSPL